MNYKKLNTNGVTEEWIETLIKKRDPLNIIITGFKMNEIEEKIKEMMENKKKNNKKKIKKLLKNGSIYKIIEINHKIREDMGPDSNPKAAIKQYWIITDHMQDFLQQHDKFLLQVDEKIDAGYDLTMIANTQQNIKSTINNVNAIKAYMDIDTKQKGNEQEVMLEIQKFVKVFKNILVEQIHETFDIQYRKRSHDKNKKEMTGDDVKYTIGVSKAANRGKLRTYYHY